MSEKAIIAMSGGVDSSVAAVLMKEQGYDCLGVTMKLFQEESTASKTRTCCSLEDVEDARSVAFDVGIPYYVFNFAQDFRKYVIDPFITAYENGMTPNPCIDCNRYLKFDKLFSRANDLGYKYVVTGHYAKITFDDATGRYLLKKADDLSKDQSYFLYALTQHQLAHVQFPLGAMKKTQVRQIAETYGFANARKQDSQDICFVPNGDYAAFIKQQTGKSFAGNFVDCNGTVLGKHKGIINYTVGQRKGLGLSLPEPFYVCAINSRDNTVALGPERELYTQTLIIRDINLIAVSSLERPMPLKAKVRSRQVEQPCIAVQIDENTIHIHFDEPQRAVAKGQAAVLYAEDVVIGGGTIQ